MIELLQRLAARLMNRVRVNDVQQYVHHGSPLFLKRRRVGGSSMIFLGNRFLSLAGSGMCMFVRIREWLDWEIHCRSLLYPELPSVEVGPNQSLILPTVNGTSLRKLLLLPGADRALVAAARELRRVHQIHCDQYRAAWSHGDLHLDNILYDVDADRVTLIDFDTRHVLHLDETARHSDDLKTVLLELMGLPDDKWCQLATVFLVEYRDFAILEALRDQLIIPYGIARVFLFTRVDGLTLRQVERRFQSLEKIIRDLNSCARKSPERECCGDASMGERNCLQDD